MRCSTTGRRALPRLHLRHRRRVARPRAPRPRARDRRSGGTLLHTSNLYFHPLQGRAGRAARGALRAAAGVLLQQRRRGRRGVPEVRAPVLVRAGDAATGVRRARRTAFHGRTCGALSVTWDEHYRAPFAAALPGVDVRRRRTIPAPLEAAVGDRTAAIIVEPIQGEGGVRPMSPALARRDRRRRARAHRRAAHRRRGAVRTAAGRAPFLLSPALGLTPGPRRARQGARRAACPIGAALVQRRGRRGGACPAITAAPTAATCWRAARRSSFSTSSSAAALDARARRGAPRACGSRQLARLAAAPPRS